MKLILLLIPFYFYSQNFKSLAEIECPESAENVHVMKLSSDKNASNFLIFVKKGVKPHVHKSHTETVYVIDGEAEMRVGNEVKKIKAGSFIIVPENTVHSVKVLSEKPLKVLSNQAPQFFGKDRVFIKGE